MVSRLSLAQRRTKGRRKDRRRNSSPAKSTAVTPAAARATDGCHGKAGSPSVRGIERVSSVLFTWSTERNVSTWTPPGREKATVYARHSPPSTRYSVRPTPLPASVAVRVNLVSASYGPSAGASVVSGGVLSTRTTAILVASTFPAKSSLYHSRRGSPSPVRLNDPI